MIARAWRSASVKRSEHVGTPESGDAGVDALQTLSSAHDARAHVAPVASFEQSAFDVQGLVQTPHQHESRPPQSESVVQTRNQWVSLS
jgi:hypothetical protein